MASAYTTGTVNTDPGALSSTGSQWGTNQQNANGSSTYNPSQYTNAQTGLATAQAGAVHDPLLAAQYGVNAQMSRFNQLLPLLSGDLSKLGTNMATAGGANTAPPPISAGPTLNPQQIQQQVNTSRAANDQSTANQQANSNASLAGRGFGSNSPLQMALNQGMQNSNMATNTANETATRLNAAQQNAAQTLNSQQALSNQWATGNQLDIQRRAPVFQQQNALIAALGGLMS